MYISCTALGRYKSQDKHPNMNLVKRLLGETARQLPGVLEWPTRYVKPLLCFLIDEDEVKMTKYT